MQPDDHVAHARARETPVVAQRRAFVDVTLVEEPDGERVAK